MLPSAERLTRSSLFSRAYTARKSVSGGILTMYVLPRTGGAGKRGQKNPSNPKENAAKAASAQAVAKIPVDPTMPSGLPRVGFVIAKKVCKSACKRNRAKRRVREAYRLFRKEQSEEVQRLGQWYAVVFVLQEKILTASWDEICKTVRESLRKAETKFGTPVRR